MDKIGVFFKKTGKEIKSSLLNKKKELEIRLNIRKGKFEKFINNPKEVASFFLDGDDMDEVKKEEIFHVGNRINEIEKELKNINLKLDNLNEGEIYMLDYYELIENGFNLID